MHTYSLEKDKRIFFFLILSSYSKWACTLVRSQNAGHCPLLIAGITLHSKQTLYIKVGLCILKTILLYIFYILFGPVLWVVIISKGKNMIFFY